MTWGEILVCEIKSIFTNFALLLTVFGGVFLYTFLYPLPYSQQLPRDQSVVLVDLDNSAVSRQLIRMVNATPNVQINRSVYSLSDAQQAIEEEGLADSIAYVNLESVNAAKAREELEFFFNVLKEDDPKSIGGKLPSDDFYYKAD